MLDYSKKPIIAMLHLMGDSRSDVLERMVREANIYYENGVDAVMVENYFGGAEDCEAGLKWLAGHFSGRLYGVNILGNYELAFRLAKDYGGSFVQIDSVCGHLPPEKDEAYAKKACGESGGQEL